MTKLSAKALVTTGALMTYLSPKLAKDARVDLTRILSGLTASNFASRKAGICRDINGACSSQLATDASNLKELPQLLDAVEDLPEPEGDPDDPEPDKGILGWLAKRLQPAELEEFKRLLAGGGAGTATDRMKVDRLASDRAALDSHDHAGFLSRFPGASEPKQQ